MGKRSTVLLLVLFFAGLGILWWARESGLPTAAERREMASRVLPGLLRVEPSEIARVEVEGPEEGQFVALERREGHWQIVEPINVLADTERVETLLRNLRELRRSPEAGDVSGDPSRFGLDPPQRRIRLYREAENEPIASLALGDELEHQRYVMPSEGPISLADTLRVAPHDADPDPWRERSLFNVYSYDIISIDIDGPDRKLEATLDRGRWRIVQPFQAPANAEKINGLLADLAELEAIPGSDGFAAEGVVDFSPFGLDPDSATTVTLTPGGLTGSDRPQTAYLGASPEDQPEMVYARREGQDDVLIVRARAVSDIGRDPQAMRSQRIVDFPPAEITALRIETGDLDLRLLKGRDGWQVVPPSGEPVPADAPDLAALLETITKLESATFFPIDQVKDTGLDQPVATIRIWLDPEQPPSRTSQADAAPPSFDQPSEVTLKIGRFDAGKKLVYGQLEGDEQTALALPETVRDLLPDNPLALRDRTIVREDPRLIRRVELSRPGRSFTLERVDDGRRPTEASWRMIEPAQAPADRLAVTMLVEALANLRAERLVETGDESSSNDSTAFGLESPRVLVSWNDGSDDASSRTLLVGAPVPDRRDECFATIEGEPSVFTIGPKLLALFSAEFRERRLLAFPTEQAERIVVRNQTGEAAFIRGESDSWEPEGSAWPDGYDPETVKKLVTGLSTLTADRIVQDDGPMPENAGLSPPVLVIELQLREVESPIRVRLGITVEDRRFVALGPDGPGAAFLVDAAPFDLPPPPDLAELPEDPFAR